MKAIVRVRIPFKRVDLEAIEGEEGGSPKEAEQLNKDDIASLEEIDYEDKILAVNT